MTERGLRVHMAAALLAAAAALAPSARAEGGLPGGLKAVGAPAPSTVASAAPDGAAITPPAAAEEPGGAVFSPFAAAAPAATAAHRSEAPAPAHRSTVFALAAAAVAAMAWLLLKPR